MKFKAPEIQRRWNEAHKHGKLQSLAVDVDNELRELYGIEPVMTEASRSHEETIALYNDPQAPVSPHEAEPLRAFDLRSHDDHGNEFPWVNALVRIVNIRWVYDQSRPEKKCALYHEVNGRGPHLHFQVCDKTFMRGIA